MARVGLHGYIENASKFAQAIPIFAMLFDQIERTLNGQLDATNLADGAVTTVKLGGAAVTEAKIAAGAVTKAVVDSTVAKIVTGQYTGDGTAGREINLGFRARYVRIIRYDNMTSFEAWGSTSSALARTQIDSSGTVADGGTDFTGSSENGFQLGSAAGGGASNADTVLYTYLALG